VQSGPWLRPALTKLKLKFPFSYFIIKDHSMEPVFCEFDRVITYNWGKIQKGSVVVFRHGSLYLIKRVKELGTDSVVAVSDNKKLAKREYKVKLADIIGRAILKY